MRFAKCLTKPQQGRKCPFSLKAIPMCRKTPEHIQAAYNEAVKFGAAFVWEVSNGNHIMGIVTLAGRTKKVFFSKTPSDFNANWDAKRNVRYALKAIGGM